MPYPFRYPTPSERRARVKRHRTNAQALVITAIVMLGIHLFGGVAGWHWFLGVTLGLVAGLGIGVLAAHRSED